MYRHLTVLDGPGTAQRWEVFCFFFFFTVLGNEDTVPSQNMQVLREPNKKTP
jgi:hypothetical protein